MRKNTKSAKKSETVNVELEGAAVPAPRAITEVEDTDTYGEGAPHDDVRRHGDDEEADSAPTSGAQAKPRGFERAGSARIAAGSIRAAIRKLNRFRWNDVSAEHGPAIVDLLASLDTMASRLSKPKKGGVRVKELAPGDRVTIRDRFKADFLDVMSAEEMQTLKLVAVRGKMLELSSDENPRVFVKASMVEKVVL